MFDVKLIKQVIEMLENETSFSPEKWETDTPIDKDVVDVKELPQSLHKDFLKSFYLKKLNEVASDKYKEFTEPAIDYFERNGLKRILSNLEKDLAYTNGGSSTTIDLTAWKAKSPKEYAKVFSEFQKTTQRKGSISWK